MEKMVLGRLRYFGARLKRFVRRLATKRSKERNAEGWSQMQSRPNPDDDERPADEPSLDDAQSGVFSEVASEKDLLACYRLIYGRHPSRDEWVAGQSQVSGSLRDMVMHHLEASKVERHGSERTAVKEIRMAQFSGFDIFADIQDAAVGAQVLVGCYEPEVTQVFRGILSSGMGVLDIGANIGYFTMLSAALVGHDGYVLAFEPNPANVRLLEASRRQNNFRHVHVAQLAAAPAAGMLVLHSSFSTGTTSEPPDEVQQLLNSTTVASVRPDTLVPSGRRINLIKVDVDGADHKALLGCSDIIARDRPFIIAEFSPSLLVGLSGVTGEQYLRWMIDLGYGLSIIQLNGSMTFVGQDWQQVIDEYRFRGTDHLDILATPDIKPT